MPAKKMTEISAKGTRRQAIAQAALEVLGIHGSRGLTHRAIDKHLRMPEGTTSAYFRRREDLVGVAVRELFKADFGHFDAQMRKLVEAGMAVTLEDVATFFAKMIRDVRFKTSETIKLARYECFLLARREPEANRLLGELFDARQELDTLLFERIGASDPVRAAIRFGFTIRGAFVTMAFLPEPAERLDLLNEAFLRRALIAAMDSESASSS